MIKFGSADRQVLGTHVGVNKLMLQINRYCESSHGYLIVGRPDGGERRGQEAARVRCVVVLGNFGKVEAR